jgi:hypothetical protein
LLVEFAIAVRRWLNGLAARPADDFSFASMDEEEAPLLGMVFVAADVVECRSVWQDGAPARLSFAEVRAALETYLSDLAAELLPRGIDLDGVYRWSQSGPSG